MYIWEAFCLHTSQMIDKFLDYLKVEKRYSPNTIISYQKDLMDFLDFVRESEGTDDLARADKKVIRNFMTSIAQNTISKRSINRKLSTLRSFYLFLLKVGEIKVSPMESIHSLKFYPEKQIPMSEDEMNHMQTIFETSERQDLLGQLIIELLYQTGIRKAELTGLLLDNIDFSKNEMRILGKGNKTRIVPFSSDLKDLMQTYLDVKRNPHDSSENHFLLSDKGNKLNEKFVYSIVNKYLSIVTSKNKKSPHILRHTFATHVLNHGAEITKVKAIMGHSSLASTQVYTEANIEQLKKVMNAAHPRAKKD